MHKVLTFEADPNRRKRGSSFSTRIQSETYIVFPTFLSKQVEERRQKIAEFSAKRLAALGVDGAIIPEPFPGGEGLAPASSRSSEYSELKHPHACCSTEGGRCHDTVLRYLVL